MSDLSEHLKSFLKFLVFIILFSGLTYITYHSIINSRNQVRAAHYYPIKPELPKLDTGPPIPILVDPGADIYKTGVTRLHYAVRDATELIRGSHINAIVISNDLSQYGGNMDNNHLYFWKGDLYLPDYMTKFDFDMVFPYMIHEVVHSATTNDLKSSYALINKEWWIPDFIATGMNNGPPAGGFHQSIEEDMAIAASKYAVKADADKLKAEKPKVYDWLKKYIFQGKEVN